MKHLSDIVSGLNIKSQPFRTQSIYDQVRENWDAIFGQLAQTLTFGYVKQNRLVVYTQNPAWTNEIGFYEKKFLEKINAYIDHKKYWVTSLKVNVQRSMGKKQVRKKRTVVRSGRSLEENIKHAREQREKLGYKPCSKCDIVLSLKDVCAFCKTS